MNVLHNLVHLLFGIFGIAAVLVGRSRIYLQAVGVIYLLLTVLGFIPGLFVGDEMLLGLVHINLADKLPARGARRICGFLRLRSPV